MSQRQHHYLIGSDTPIVYSEQPKWKEFDFFQGILTVPVHRGLCISSAFCCGLPHLPVIFPCSHLMVLMQSLGEKKKGEEDEQLWRRKTGSKDKQRQEAAGGWGKDKARWGWITVAQISRKGEDQQQREIRLEKKGERRPRHNEKGQRWIIDRAMGQGTWCTVELKLCRGAEFYWVVAADPVGFPGGKELVCQAGDAGDPDFIPGSGRSPGEGNGNHSSILVWEIPWTEEPGGPQSMGSQRAGHDWATEHVHKWTQWMAQENKEVGVLTVGQSRVPSILLPQPLTSCFCS